MFEVVYRPIGIIHSPFKKPRGTPIQASAAEGTDGMIQIFSEYTEGLRDIEGFSHIILIYHFHMCQGASLTVTPFLDDRSHGVFSTRAPARPNPIGLSIVRLISIQGERLFIRDIDMIDGTYLLDIKPYVPAFDVRDADRIGWLKKNVDQLNRMKDDGRFEHHE